MQLKLKFEKCATSSLVLKNPMFLTAGFGKEPDLSQLVQTNRVAHGEWWASLSANALDADHQAKPSVAASVMFSKCEHDLLCGFIDQLLDRFSTDGCNDMVLDNTPENMAIALAAERLQTGDIGAPVLTDRIGRIVVSNTAVLECLKQKLMAIAN